MTSEFSCGLLIIASRGTRARNDPMLHDMLLGATVKGVVEDKQPGAS